MSRTSSTDSGSASTVSWLSIGVDYGSNGYTIRNITDAFDRRTSSTVTMYNGTTNTVYSTEIGYTTGWISGVYATGTQVGSFNSSINGSAVDSLGYEYDGNGNITRIYIYADGTTMCTYEYDNLNRLTRENNSEFNETYVYTYDNGENITSKKTYAYTTGTLGAVQATDTYDYGSDIDGWNDRLIGYKGVDITYDASGNPLSYYNGSSYTFTWTQGRRLATAVKGSTNVSYTYNESGIRTSKTVDGTKHTYVLNGTSVYSDTWNEGSITHVVVYIYDDNGSPVGMMYRNSTMGEGVFEYYIFAKNLQGDITAVYDEYGSIVVKYTYDAWGNITETFYDTTSNGQYNSFRYRGYFYDEETGLYYLNSRYYDPAIGRFLNADVFINANGDLTGFNMYAYCSNNPVMFVDNLGTAAELAVGAGYLIYKLVESAFVALLAVGGVVFSASIAIEGVKTFRDAMSDVGEDEKVDTKDISKDINPPKYYYWEADLIGKSMVIGKPLTVEEAAFRVSQRKSILCENQLAAKHILYLNGYRNAVGPERGKGEGFLWHYHPTRNHTGYKSVHIWFKGLPILAAVPPIYIEEEEK